MNKILISSLTVFALVVAVAGGTFALFSDTAAIAGNTIATGTLDLTLNHSAGKPFSISNAYPGYISSWEHADVYNTGSLPFEAQLSLSKDSGDDGLWAEVNIEIKTVGWDSDCTNGDDGEKTIYSGPVSSFTNGMTVSDIAYWHLANEDDGSGPPDNVRAGYSERLCQRVGVDTDAGNEVQGKSVIFTETVDAVQDDD